MFRNSIILITIILVLPVVTKIKDNSYAQSGYEIVAEIPVGLSPADIALNPATNRIYVTNYQENSVSVIDGDTNTVIATVLVGNAPGGIGVNPTNNKIYVANSNSGSPVYVIDGQSNSVVKQIAIANNARGVAINPFTNKVYVSTQPGGGGPIVEVIDSETDILIDSIVAPYPLYNSGSGIAVNTWTNRVYVQDNNSSLVVIDGSNDTVTTFIPNLNVNTSRYGLDINSKTNRIYSTGNRSLRLPITVIDGAINGIITNVPIVPETAYPQDIAVNSVTNKIFVSSYRGTISVLNGDTNQFIDNPISVGGNLLGIAVNTKNSHIYAVDNLNNRVVVIKDTQSQPCSSKTDTDKDGLLDGWEICGYTHSDGGFVDLPALGADPYIKDIFVEIDYMVQFKQCPGGFCPIDHTHVPNKEAIKRVVDAFSRRGIHLHVDYGEYSINYWGNSKNWGNLSEGNWIPHEEYLSPTDNEWNSNLFTQIKLKNFHQERWPIFHYAIFAHYLGGQRYGQVIDISRMGGGGEPGSDLMITLGAYKNERGNTTEQAGALMHELGHNLGLHHGGEDGIEKKPNYISNMNYLFVQHGIIYNHQDGWIDFSGLETIADPLYENSLDEIVGLNREGSDFPDQYGTRWYCNKSNKGWVVSSTTDANNAINWDCIGFADGRNVSADINYDSNLTVLNSFDDWDSSLDFNGGCIGNDIGPGECFGEDLYLSKIFDFAIPVDFHIEDQLPKIKIPYAVNFTQSGDIVAPIGVNATIPFTITNSGELTSTIIISKTEVGSWLNTFTIPLTVTLAPKENFPFEVELTIPESSTEGNSQRLSLLAFPEESPRMLDEIEVTVYSGLIAWFDAEPISGIVPHEVNYTDLSVGDIYKWLWDFGDGFTSTQQNPIHVYTKSGIYSVSLTVTGINGQNTYLRNDLVRVTTKTLFLPLISK